MFSPEEQQIEICLLKSNLEEIESDLIEQVIIPLFTTNYNLR